MLCETESSYNKEKEGDNLSSNRLINVKILTTNVDEYLVYRKCAQEKAVQMKLEEEKDWENFISYAEAYNELNTSYGQKGIRLLQYDLKKQKSNLQTRYHENYFSMTFYEQSYSLVSTIVCNCVRNKQEECYSIHQFNLHITPLSKIYSGE